MKKNRGKRIGMDILLWSIFVGIGIFLNTDYSNFLPMPLQLILTFGLIMGILFEKRLNPYRKYETLVHKAQRVKNKDREKAILLLEEALEIERLSKIDEATLMRKLAKLYHDEGHKEKEEAHYKRATDLLKEVLERSKVSESDKLNTLAYLSLLYYDQKKYKQASEYGEYTIEIGLNKRNFKLNDPALRFIMESFVYSNQQQKGRELYRTLLLKRRIKRNRSVEELLGIGQD